MALHGAQGTRHSKKEFTLSNWLGHRGSHAEGTLQAYVSGYTYTLNLMDGQDPWASVASVKRERQREQSGGGWEESSPKWMMGRGNFGWCSCELKHRVASAPPRIMAAHTMPPRTMSTCHDSYHKQAGALELGLGPKEGLGR